MYYSAFSASLVRRPARRAVPISRPISRRHSESDFRTARAPFPLRTRSYSFNDLGKASAPLHRDHKSGIGFLRSMKTPSRGFSAGTDEVIWKRIGHAREFVKTISENLSKAKRIEGFRAPSAHLSSEEVIIDRRKDELRHMAKTVLDLGRSKLGNFRKGILSVTRNTKAESDITSLSHHHRKCLEGTITKEGWLFGPDSKKKRSWIVLRSCNFAAYEHDPQGIEDRSPAFLLTLRQIERIGLVDSCAFYLQFKESENSSSQFKFWGEDEADASSWVIALRSIITNSSEHGDNT